MRKLIKEQLSEIIQTIYEAIELCKKQPDINLLADCQNAAVFVGQKIEESEGEGTAAVMRLEQFAELLYNAGLSIDNSTELRKALNKSRDKLKQAEHEIKAKLPLTYEILFLPYKASMWDSFDSIYREAVKDSSCNVVVMPSPYFNINPKREILSVEYEGDQFPEYVTITYYEKYNIANNRPDVIFIHNPYDDCNLITQLPPQYFSSELAKHTDRLVYIPYFVNDGSYIREHYCQTPAVANAWRTFVHSEKVREGYCKFNPSEKIVALGSPKFDMVVNYENNKPEIPQAWASVFEGRKVFLYNTHLRNIMADAEKMIDKLDYIFSVFEKRDDTVLLWRPHPLSIQTAKSMSPYILDRYMKLIERFKKMPNGVYDDTADIHRAIAVSDAYIGDMSSVVSMYGVTGKPMFIMNEPNVDIDDALSYVLAYSGAEGDDGTYIFSGEYNALMRVKNNIAEYICSADGINSFTANAYVYVLRKDNELFLIPHSSQYIFRYNLITKEQKTIKVDKETAGAWSECLYNNNIYMTIALQDTMIKYNIETNKITRFDNMLNGDYRGMSIFAHVTAVDNYMFIPCHQDNRLIVWDMNTDKTEVVKIPQISDGCNDIIFWKDDIYILTYGERNIWKWNRKNNSIECILKNTGASRIYVHNGNMFIIPGVCKNICRVNLNTLVMTEIPYPKDFRFLKTYKSTWNKYDNYKIRNEYMCLFPKNSNMYLELNMDTFELKGIKWQFSDEFMSEEFKKPRRIYSNYLYYEGKCDIHQFISFALNDTYKEQRKKFMCVNIVNYDGSAGKRIWEYINNNLK